MNYELKTQAQVTTTQVLKVADCLNCGEPIPPKNVHEYEDQYGFISTIRCSSCNNLTKTLTTIKSCIEEWNSKNEIPLVLESHAQQIENLKAEIKRLKVLSKTRAKR